MLPWRREGSRESSEPLPMPKGAPGELERDWGQGMEGQDTGNAFTLTEISDRWDIGKELFPVRVLAQGAQRSCPWIAGSVQGQVGRDLKAHLVPTPRHGQGHYPRLL